MAKLAKSIRIEPDVYAYIERYKGEGFNEKFENIIRDAMESEKKRLDRIKQLEIQIKEKEKQFFTIQNDVSKLTTLQYRILDIQKAFKDIEDKLEIKPEARISK